MSVDDKERAEIERAMNNPDEWADPLPYKKRSEKRRMDTIVSVRLDSEQLHALDAAAKARGIPISRYLRECGLRTAELPYVKITYPSGPFAITGT